MARTDGRLLPANADIEQRNLFAALLNSGVTKVANSEERLLLSAPVVVDGVTPIELVLQLDTSQFYRWSGTPPTLIPVYPALRFNPPPQIAALLQAETGQPATVLNRSAAAIAYPGTIGENLTRVAMDIGGGYPREVVQTTSDPVTGSATSTVIAVSPLRGELSTTTAGSSFLVFTLAAALTPTPGSNPQESLVVRGSTTETAVLSSDIFAGGAAPGQPAGNLPSPTAAGTFLASTGTDWNGRRILLNDITGFERAGAPSVGDTVEFTNDGWRYVPQAASGIDFSTGLDGQLVGRGVGNVQAWYTPNFDLLQGFLPLGKFVDPAGLPVDGVPQIIDTAGVRSWRVQVPSFSVPDGSLTPAKLDVGDASKRLAFRTAQGFPNGADGAVLRMGASNTVVAGENFFPADSTLELFQSSTISQRINAASGGFSFADSSGNSWMGFYPIRRFGGQPALPGSVRLTATRLHLAGTSGLWLSGRTDGYFIDPGPVTLQGGTAAIPTGMALGIGSDGNLAGLSVNRPQAETAHWSGTLTPATGGAGTGYDTPHGGTSFGALTPLTFTWAGTTYTVRQLVKDAQGAIKLTVKPDSDTVDDGWVFYIEGHRLAVSDATSTGVARYQGVSREYTWTGQTGVDFTVGTPVRVYLGHPINELPEPGPDGQVLTAASGAWVSAPPAAGGQPSQPTGPGVVFTDVIAQRHYSAASSGNATTTPNQALPSGFGTANQFIDLQVGLSTGNTHGQTLIRTSYLAGLTGTATLAVGGISLGGYGAGTVRYRPSTRELSVRTHSTANPRITRLSLMQIAGGAGGGGSSTFAGLTDTAISNPAEYQIPVYNAAGNLVNTDPAVWLDSISFAGRKLVVEKPASGPDSQYATTTLTGAVLPTDYDAYDFVVCEYTDNTTRWNAGTPVTTYVIPVRQLVTNDSLTNIQINGASSRMDWTRSNRTLSAGDTADRFLRVTLVRGQGPEGAMGAAGRDGTGASLAVSGLPSALGTAARGVSLFAAAFDHVHPTELVDDSILPSYAIADIPKQQKGWQERLNVAAATDYDTLPFGTTTVTVGSLSTFRGWSSETGATFGSATNTTFTATDGVVYTNRDFFYTTTNDNLGLTITPAPPTSGDHAFTNWVLRISSAQGIHKLQFSDATRNSNTDYGTPGTQFEWTNIGQLFPASGEVRVSVEGPIHVSLDQLETRVDSIRQVPAPPADPTTKVLFGDNVFRPAPDPAITTSRYQTRAITNVAQVTTTSTANQTVALASLSGDHAAQGITLRSNALYFARPGLYHVEATLTASILSSVRSFINLGNTNQAGTVDELWPWAGQPSGILRSAGTIKVDNANDYITLQWVPLDLPALSNQVPTAPTAIGTAGVAGSPGHYTVTWSYGGTQRVNTWHLEWRFTGESQWHAGVIEINRQAARQATIDTRTTVTTGIDVRIWGSNQSGTGLWAQRNWTGGVYSSQTGHSQTFAASGNIVVTSQEVS